MKNQKYQSKTQKELHQAAAIIEAFEELLEKHKFTPENVQQILQQEVGAVFCRVLQDAGVYKRNEDGKAAFLRFLEYVNG